MDRPVAFRRDLDDAIQLRVISRMATYPLPLKIPPGVLRGGTEYRSKGRWYDSDLVRTYEPDLLGPIKGWQVKSTSAVSGMARALVTWRDNTGTRRAAIATHSNFYVMTSAGVLTDITPLSFTAGRADATLAIGYGTGLYGVGTYGTPRSDSAANPLAATVCDVDVWGQHPVFCSPDDGKLYEWQLSGVATQITNSPENCVGLVVHPKLFIVALGAGGNPRRFAWCGRRVNTAWAADATNQAGGDEIPAGNLMTGRAVGDQVLMLSDIDAYAVDYVGLPNVLVARPVGSGCGAISKGCIVSTGSFAAWWSKSGFWAYDGVVRLLRCDVWDDLARTLTVSQQSKITGWHNVKNQEIWWFYPSGGIENSKYVMWSYKNDHWYVGTMPRTAACAAGVFETPFAIKPNGYVYDHETGAQYDGAMPFARSGPIELGDGANVLNVLGIIPDENTAGQVTVSFRTRPYPNGTETILGTTTLNSSGRADIRFAARQAELVVTGAAFDDWRWGQPRLEVRGGGGR